MRRISTLFTAVIAVVLLLMAVDAQRPEPRRPSAPMLTNEDLLSPGTATTNEESVSRPKVSGSPLRNARVVLESLFTRMAEVNSVRTRMRGSLPEGEREILLESIKPDRLHVISPEMEIIAIGRKSYVKNAGRWELTAMPDGGPQSSAGFDFRTLVKQMISKPSVHITGQVLGTQMLGGVDTIAYEFAITEGSENGTIQISVGKADGYMRQMSVSGGAINIKFWFTDINQRFSIEPPIM